MLNSITNPMQINDIRFLAYAVNAIASQQDVGDFCLNYNFANTTFVTEDDSTQLVSKHNARYDAVKDWIQQQNPTMHEAFVPHAVNMLLKEALTTMNTPVHDIVTDIRMENGETVFCSYLFPDSFSLVMNPEIRAALQPNETDQSPDSAYRAVDVNWFMDDYQNNKPDEEILKDIRSAYYDVYMKDDFTQIYHGNEEELPEHFRSVAEKAAEEVLTRIKEKGGEDNE